MFIKKLKYEDTITFFNRAEYFYPSELSNAVTKYAICNILKGSGKSIAVDALEYMANRSLGYPYLIQLFGFHAFEAAEGCKISIETVKEIEEIVIDKFVERVIVFEYSDIFKTLSRSEKKLMRAIALPTHNTERKELLVCSGLTVTNYNSVRASLITKGPIEQIEHGSIDYVDEQWQVYFKRAK
ncbi:MAG: hypothetical protein LBP35_04695 [Candidatus Ancillula trichonymphae]|nr:hypothetical protein [Candidatus Ancillula trichonymphae]